MSRQFGDCVPHLITDCFLFPLLKVDSTSSHRCIVCLWRLLGALSYWQSFAVLVRQRTADWQKTTLPDSKTTHGCCACKWTVLTMTQHPLRSIPEGLRPVKGVSTSHKKLSKQLDEASVRRLGTHRRTRTFGTLSGSALNEHKSRPAVSMVAYLQ